MQTHVNLLQTHNICTAPHHLCNAPRQAIVPEGEIAEGGGRCNELKGVLVVEVVGQDVE
jgi:hypothetical protein